MTFADSLILEFIKFTGALILLLLAWFVGQRISAKWNVRQKQKEYDIVTARDFHDLYGEFYAIQKLWNYYRRDVGAESLPGASRWSLLERACKAEAKLESTLVRLASDKPLKKGDIVMLGRFRPLYQQLRESIRDDEPLNWGYSEHPDYLAFKTLATQIAVLIAGTGLAREICSNNLIEITSNKHESH